MAQKKYVVPIERLVIDCEYGWPELPEPSDDPPLAGARIPNVSLQVPGLVVLYRNQPVVDAPLGVPEPFNNADAAVTPVAAAVVAVGGSGVVNCTSVPNAVPTEFCAMAQKKYVVPGLKPVMPSE